MQLDHFQVLGGMTLTILGSIILAIVAVILVVSIYRTSYLIWEDWRKAVLYIAIIALCIFVIDKAKGL